MFDSEGREVRIRYEVGPAFRERHEWREYLPVAFGRQRNPG